MSELEAIALAVLFGFLAVLSAMDHYGTSCPTVSSRPVRPRRPQLRSCLRVIISPV